VKSSRDAEFRLELADGFLKEADQDLGLSRWRSCVDNAQMSVENSAKAVIALRRPVPKVHQVKSVLAGLRKDPEFERVAEEVVALADISFEAHIRRDYGDEGQYRTPWELFDRKSAEEALGLARNARDHAAKVLMEWSRRKQD
jgi:HEPN domain-containing protein